MNHALVVCVCVCLSKESDITALFSIFFFFLYYLNEDFIVKINIAPDQVCPFSGCL